MYLVYTDDWFLISGGVGLWSLQKWAEYNLKLPKPKPGFWKPGPLLWKNSNGIILEQGGSVVFAHVF